MTMKRALAAMLTCGLLAACSSVPYAQRTQQRIDAYNSAAGAPQRSFRFIGRMYSWEALSSQQLVIYTLPNRAFLLDVAACPNLNFAMAVGVTSSINEVSVGFDRVLTGRNYMPCPIRQIRPVDLAKLKLEKEAQREVQTPSRDSAPVPAPATGNP